MLGIGGGTSSVWLATAGVSLASVFHLDEEQGLATGLVTSTQQVGITIGIPLLGVLATTGTDLLAGARTVLLIDAAVVLVAAALVATGLRARRDA